MGANYVLLETITVGEAGASSVTFNNIPQTGYTDLKIVMSVRSTYTTSNTVDTLDVQFNGITSGYTAKDLYTFSSGTPGSGSYTTQSAGGTTMGRISDSSVTVSASGITANTFNNAELYIPNYTSSNAKSYSFDAVSENNSSSYTSLTLAAGLWSYTGQPAINKVTFGVANGNFAQYSTFTLYGLAAVGTTPVIAPYASGGDIIQTDGTYWYHAFLSSGTFTPAKGLSCDVLRIAGGGGGGRFRSGGGGAGGLVYSASQSLNGSYTVVIGAGGAGSTDNSYNGVNGANTTFTSLSAAIGGGGGGSDSSYVNGSNGGSGGGGCRAYAGGTGSQGSNGGSSSDTAPNYGGGGGGGFSTAGTTGTNLTGGNGGAGTNTYATWATATSTGVSGFYAGGGGGGTYNGGTPGTGGAGGGGAASAANSNGNGIAGTANTGGGGGGNSISTAPSGAGGNGGSGIVIVRYAI